MSAPNAAPLTGLGGLPSTTAIQGAIKAELLGVDLSAFGSLSGAAPTAEAVARKDPGASTATLTFVKSGQSLPLPLDLAKALIGQASGSAQIAVEIVSQGADGAVSASLKKITTSTTVPDAGPADATAHGPASFSKAGSSLAAAAAVMAANSSAGLGGAGLWANTISQLASQVVLQALATPAAQGTLPGPGTGSSPANTQASSTLGASVAHAGEAASLGLLKNPAALASHFEAALASLGPGAGIGYERALARISTMGPQSAQVGIESLSKFAQASQGTDASGPWLAQQARAQETGEIQWAGKAWQGAPMSAAWGVGESTTPEAAEAKRRCSVDEKEGLAWMRFRIEPEGLGPIDVWAVLLGGGRCQARLRAGAKARARIEEAQKGFGPMLEAARVDLAVSFEREDSNGQ